MAEVRQRSEAMQRMLDNAKNDPIQQQQAAATKEKQFGTIGSAEAAHNKSTYETNYASGNTIGQQIAKNPTTVWSPSSTPDYSKPSTPVPNLFNPGQSAGQSAGFDGSNWNDKSGVYLGNGNGQYNQVSHKEATANNPLHVVNAQRNGNIQDAIKSGDWTQYNNFAAGQQPGFYDKQADGNFVQNKQYYANLLESSVQAMREAERNGDTAGIQHWQNAINTRLADLQKAPGMMPSINGINNNADFAAQYGVSQADRNWFDSAYNNPQVAQDGRYTQNHWTQNAVFQNDPALLQQALNFSGSYGSPDEQKLRQQINSAPEGDIVRASQPILQPGAEQYQGFGDALMNLIGGAKGPTSIAGPTININTGKVDAPLGDADPNVAGVTSKEIEMGSLKDALERYYAKLWGER